MKASHVLLTFVTALAVTLLPGCETVDVREGPGPGVRVRSGLAPYATVRLNTVAILDDSLQDWDGPPGRKGGKIAVERTNASRTETGTLVAWALLRNRTDYPLQIEGRVQFFDEAEAPLEGPTAWQRLHLPPNSVITYRGNSTQTDRVKYYLIEIREGR